MLLINRFEETEINGATADISEAKKSQPSFTRGSTMNRRRDVFAYEWDDSYEEIMGYLKQNRVSEKVIDKVDDMVHELVKNVIQEFYDSWDKYIPSSKK